MIQGVALQVMRVNGAWIDAEQVMLFPAAKIGFSRRISDAHPKRAWRKKFRYDERLPFDSGAPHPALRTRYEDRVTADWHLTGDPVGFQITDAEYLEMVAGRLPRNVGLRYQKAIEAMGGNVIGKDAVSPVTLIGADFPRMSTLTGGARTIDRLRELIAYFAKGIADDSWVVLRGMTPPQARARGAGRHRNASDLPKRDEAPRPLVEPAPAPTPAPTPAPARPLREGVVLPGQRLIDRDGATYIARAVACDDKHMSDVQLYRDAYAADMNVMLLGEPGTGKTKGLVAAFDNAIVFQTTGDTEVSDLIGAYTPTGPDAFMWIDGPLVKAMEEGRMLIMDEGGLADSKVLAVLYPLMDKKGEARKLHITANPARGTIVAKDGFGVAFTSNPDARGVVIAEPLLSRCAITMTVTTDYAAMRMLGCNERLVQAAEHMAKQRANGELGWAPEARNLLDARDLEAKFGITMALRALIMQAPAMEREVVETQLRERFGDIPGAAKQVKALGI